MFGKSFLLLALVVAVSSLECVFEVVADPTSLNIQGGTDKCEAEDNYYLKIDFNSIKAKGCSRTSGKITGVGMQEFAVAKKISAMECQKSLHVFNRHYWSCQILLVIF
ncbi:hypothetical protein L5515_006792 [Caenorhabditis briggsae]|uniref:Uncharacterized protein n=1 Tax=Caenorhabditis briggsae TaxID=6238 RepID=A0AAE9F2U4_CAEBR|nr:hypothetical protein L5515_006792 [Caenorhabditis briggsae]